MRTHGKNSTYRAGCRCEECLAAAKRKRERYQATATRRRRQQRYAQLPHPPRGFCPICDEWFATPHGQAVHEGMAHRYSSTRVEQG